MPEFHEKDAIWVDDDANLALDFLLEDDIKTIEVGKDEVNNDNLDVVIIEEDLPEL